MRVTAPRPGARTRVSCAAPAIGSGSLDGVEMFWAKAGAATSHTTTGWRPELKEPRATGDPIDLRQRHRFSYTASFPEPGLRLYSR
jgi:hypothetical protein